MSERFTRLFSLQPNLYAETSPVTIAAGALLKDNQSGKVLVQLKLRNIGAKEIKAARVSVCPMDTVGAPLGEALEHQYLDLTAKRGEEFGAKTPLPLADAATRAFSVTVTEVIFADNSIWKATGALWGTLPRPAKLEDTLEDAELLRQYHMKYGATCKYEPTAHKDLWYCTCGALNRQGEACHACERALPDLQRIDLAELRAERDARLAAEKAAAEEKARAEAAAAEARAKKAKKTAIIVVPLLAVIVAAYFLTTLVIIPTVKYNKAVDLMDAGQYEEAIAAFMAMEGYKDSEEQISACETVILDSKYGNAIALMDAGNPFEACRIFASLDGYKDSNELIADFWDKTATRDTLAAGDMHTVCLKSNGAVDAVGYNYDGECDVYGWTDIVAVAAGDSHTVGLKSDGTVVAVGWNDEGQCDVSDWTDIVAVAADFDNTIGLKSDGTVVTAGDDFYDDEMSSWTNIVAVAAGGHTVGLKADGTAVAVGGLIFYPYDESDWTGIKLPK